MGKTPKPLTILVHSDLFDTPEVQALAAKGHNIIQIAPPESLANADLVIGPNCWRMTSELLPYLDLAIKGARGVKYPRKTDVQK